MLIYSKNNLSKYRFHSKIYYSIKDGSYHFKKASIIYVGEDENWIKLNYHRDFIFFKIDKKNLESFVLIVEVFTDKDIYELEEIINFKAIFKYEEVLDNFFTI